MKNVWYNKSTGEFSNSWLETDHPAISTDELIEYSKDSDWVLIEYNILNGNNFEFCHGMKIK